ncbi:MAG: hypothetical protein WDW36_003046 [Sanguina aurantia]
MTSTKESSWSWLARSFTSTAEAPPASPVAHQAAPVEFCSKEFPDLLRSFVSSVVDSGFNGVGTAVAPQSGQLAKPSVPLVVPAAARVIAIGDVHGDLNKTVRAFRLAGLIDGQGRWSGGKSVCVQVGDQLDRGDEELRILYFFERLQQEAAAAGGALHVLNGNHETMNIMGDSRYATAGANSEIQRWYRWQEVGARLRAQCGVSDADYRPLQPTASPAGMGGSSRELDRVRASAMAPGSAITRRFFAEHPMVVQVGSSVFVHGGILPEHVNHGLSKINSEAKSWLRDGSSSKPPDFVRGSTAIVWARDYSQEDKAKCNCTQLEAVLRAIPGAQRMVVGHTIQRVGVNTACNDQVVRVDVGMSRGCGDHEVEVVEILNDTEIRRLRAGAAPEVLVSASGAPGNQHLPGATFATGRSVSPSMAG